MSASAVPARSEITSLTPEQKQGVSRRLERARVSCAHCGGTDFIVGDVLYLGFLFQNEAEDAYIVGLTCTNPGCPSPRTGLTLPGYQLGL